MKNINKEKIVKFINTKEGKKVLLYVGGGMLLMFVLIILWKTILIVGCIVGVGYLIMKYRDRKKE